MLFLQYVVHILRRLRSAFLFCLRGVLTGDDLTAARDAVVTYAEADPSQLPPPFDRIRRENDADVYPADRVNIASHLSHAFAFDKSLERIIFHERVWVSHFCIVCYDLAPLRTTA